MSRCPHPQCQREKKSQEYACRQHWFQLPKPIRDDIWRGYRYDSALWHKADTQARNHWDAAILKKAEEDKQGRLFG